MSIEQQTRHITDCGIIAILRGGFTVDEVLTIAETLVANEITVLEITLNSPAALHALPELQRRFGAAALIGAGTVRDVAGWTHAVENGAAFTVAPNFDAEVARRAQARGLLHIPGVATPTEAVAAASAGCRLQKLFPAGALGGPAYLKAIRAPLDDIAFVPVGGVEVDTMRDYLRVGAVAVGLGSSLIPAHDWTTERIAALSAAARAVVTGRPITGRPKS